jgi:transposase
MSQRTRILAEVFGFQGWRIREAFFEGPDGKRVQLLGLDVRADTNLVLSVERRWRPRCSGCGATCHRTHATLRRRRWADLSWALHRVEIEATPVRVKCRACGDHPGEMLAWADPYQRQTRRLQQRLALEAASMPVMHVAAIHGLDWSTVRSAEGQALARWNATRAEIPLRQVGIDEKFLGRRSKRKDRFVTIVSNLATGEPLWIGPGRGTETVAVWLSTLTSAQKAQIQLFAMDMHEPFRVAIRDDSALDHAAIVHDPFHIMKRAGEAITEIRKDTFFRAGAKMRGIGRGTRWLVLRAWKRTTGTQREELCELFRYNRLLARAYQIVEELREVLKAPDRSSMDTGLTRILRRTQFHCDHHLRKLHDSLLSHRERILALGEFHPPTGRTEALNNNWETLVRRARGYRDLLYLLLKLRFATANPVRTEDGTKRFLALGLPAPQRTAA